MVPSGKGTRRIDEAAARAKVGRARREARAGHAVNHLRAGGELQAHTLPPLDWCRNILGAFRALADGAFRLRLSHGESPRLVRYLVLWQRRKDCRHKLRCGCGAIQNCPLPDGHIQGIGNRVCSKGKLQLRHGKVVPGETTRRNGVLRLGVTLFGSECAGCELRLESVLAYIHCTY